EGATPFVGLLSAFSLLLNRASGQSDILIGTATADRFRPEWERLVGYFLNQVAVRTSPGGAATSGALLRQTRDRVHEALESQDYPFGLLVKKLQPRRDPARPPIFQVMFIWDKPGQATAPDGPATANGLRLEPLVM